MLTILEYLAAGQQKSTRNSTAAVAAEVVTAEVLQHRREPRPFLGLCVGGGSVGMVTSLEFRPHPLWHALGQWAVGWSVG
jgi:hypothetical protein